jgi:hypothetical protein
MHQAIQSRPRRTRRPTPRYGVAVAEAIPSVRRTSAHLDESLAALTLAYTENAKVAAIFWEWRHKVMTFFFTATAALIAVAGWGYSHGLGRFNAIPLLVAGLLSFVAAGLNLRTGRILLGTYMAGALLERELAALFDDATTGKWLIYSRMLRSRVQQPNTFFSPQQLKHPTYEGLLNIAFITLGALLWALTVLVLTGHFLNGHAAIPVPVPVPGITKH